MWRGALPLIPDATPETGPEILISVSWIRNVSVPEMITALHRGRGYFREMGNTCKHGAILGGMQHMASYSPLVGY